MHCWELIKNDIPCWQRRVHELYAYKYFKKQFERSAKKYKIKRNEISLGKYHLKGNLRCENIDILSELIAEKYFVKFVCQGHLIPTVARIVCSFLYRVMTTQILHVNAYVISINMDRCLAYCVKRLLNF